MNAARDISKKLVFFFIAVVLVFGVLLLGMSLPKPGVAGNYKPFSGLSYCTSEPVCFHEAGHALDQKMNYPSQSTEFINASTFYLITTSEYEPLHNQIVYTVRTTNQNIMSETYAWIFAYFSGDPSTMPDYLQQFYDAKLAKDVTTAKSITFTWYK